MKTKYGIMILFGCLVAAIVAVMLPEILKWLSRRPVRRVGLVLSGGCVRGAYEVGVWKALEEIGISKHIGAFSGTSIGSINAALFAYGEEIEVYEKVWKEAVGDVFVMNDSTGGDTIAEFFQMALAEGFDRAVTEAKLSIDGERRHDGLCSANKLRKLLEAHLPRYWALSPPDVYATAIERSTRRLTRFKLNGKSSSQYIDYLLASAAVPLMFNPVEIGGVEYLDGGIGKGGDNTPIDPIVAEHPEIDLIVVVYLQCQDKLENRVRKENYPGRQILEIIPSRDVSGTWGITGSIDTSSSSVKSLMELGYQDAMNAFEDVRHAPDKGMDGAPRQDRMNL